MNSAYDAFYPFRVRKNDMNKIINNKDWRRAFVSG